MAGGCGDIHLDPHHRQNSEPPGRSRVKDDRGLESNQRTFKKVKFFLVMKLTLGIWIDDNISFDTHSECRVYANQLEKAGMIVICEPRIVHEI